MNRTYLVIFCIIILITTAYGVKRYKQDTSDIDDNGLPDYTRRLIRWAKQYKSVQNEDISHIEEATTMKQLFLSLKKVPTCRSAKLIAYLYFSIYVERDSNALRMFIDLMKEYYPDPYQWDNALKWKHANHLVWSTYDNLPKKTEDSSKDNPQDKPQDNKQLSKLQNFKAVLSTVSSEKEKKKNNI